VENIVLKFYTVDWSPWLVVGIALASLASALFFYWRNAKRLTGRRLTALAAFRIAGLLALLGCVFQPALRFEKTIVKRSKLLILLDTSKSMSISDARGAEATSRLGRVKRAIPSFIRGLKDFNVELYSFDAAAGKLDSVKDIDTIKPEGQLTFLDQSIRQVAGEHQGEDIAAIIPVTDGIDNSPSADYATLERLGVKVFPVGVGTQLSTLETFKDIIIKKVVPEKYAVVDSKTRIKVSVENLGFENPVLDLQMRTLDGNVVAKRQALLGSAKGDQEFVLEYTPDKVGKFPFEVFAPPDKLEKIKENNTQSFVLNVIDPRIRVLYIEGSVRNEYKWIKRILDQDPQVEFVGLIRVRKNIFQRQGAIDGVTIEGLPKSLEELRQFKVLVIGDLDRTFLNNERLNIIEQGVREGMGFLMLGGYNSFGPGGYADTPIEKLLPVQCGLREIGQEKDRFALKLTRDGLASPVFNGILDYFDGPKDKAARALNTLNGCVRFQSVKPTGKVLAVHPFRKLGTADLPVLVAHEYGSGRAAAFAADTTWRWRSVESVYRQFWGQTVRYLAQRKIEKEAMEPGVRVYLDRGFYEPGETVSIFADVRGEGGRAEKSAQVDAQVQSPEGRKTTRPLDPVSGSEGNYRAEFKPASPGLYNVLVTAKKGTMTLGTGKITFQVGKPNLEYEQLDIKLDDLKKIASVTGGQYFYLTNIGGLQEVLEARIRSEKKLGKASVQEPHELLIAFLLFVGFITTELALRRSWQLT